VTLLMILFLHLYSSQGFSASTRRQNRLFLDTAIEEEWSALLPLGIFHGITTNPILLERAGLQCTETSVQCLAKKALKMKGCNEFMCHTWGISSDEMYKIGMNLSETDRGRIIIKVPVTFEGTKAASRLMESGVRVCLTACFSPHQTMIAAGLGAEYIAPYLGRMMDNGIDGVEECKKMQAIVSGMGSDTRVMVASIRNINAMADLTSCGICTLTVSPNIVRDLFDVTLTSLSAEDINEAVFRCGFDPIVGTDVDMNSN